MTAEGVEILGLITLNIIRRYNPSLRKKETETNGYVALVYVAIIVGAFRFYQDER